MLSNSHENFVRQVLTGFAQTLEGSQPADIFCPTNSHFGRQGLDPPPPPPRPSGREEGGVVQKGFVFNPWCIILRLLMEKIIPQCNRACLKSHPHRQTMVVIRETAKCAGSPTAALSSLSFPSSAMWVTICYIHTFFQFLFRLWPIPPILSHSPPSWSFFSASSHCVTIVCEASRTVASCTVAPSHR